MIGYFAQKDPWAKTIYVQTYLCQYDGKWTGTTWDS